MNNETNEKKDLTVFEKEAYDEVFQHSDKYKQHYKNIAYYPIWNYIVKNLNKDCKYVDIGCGPGHFGHMMFDNGFKNFIGIDFSTIAINIAKELVPSYSWVEGDLRQMNFDTYTDYDFVSIKSFEHLDNDIEIIKRLPKNNITFSVPNYWSPNHYRVYPDENFILDYYKDVMKIDNIVRFVMRKYDKFIYVVKAKII